MRKLMLGAAAAAMTLVAGAASAQPYYGYDRGYAYDRSYGYRDSDRDGRPDVREWNRDRDRDGRPDQYDRYDNRRGGHGYQGGYRYYGGNHGYHGYSGRWRTGHRYPYYNQNRYVISDYRDYGLPAPHRGYRYYRDNNGDVVMAAIATGVIGLIIAGALSDHNDHYRYGY